MKHYWLVYWFERWPDETVQKFKTAVRAETFARAAQLAEAELNIRAKANGTEVFIDKVRHTFRDVSDLVGKSEVVDCFNDWPE